MLNVEDHAPGKNLIDGGDWGCSDVRPSQTETPMHERDRS